MMNKFENFNQLVERAMRTSGRTNMRPVIAKELLHYDILYCLDINQLLDKLTFQGGTSLRLCYGAPRLSEDLDFVGGREFATTNLNEMKNCLERYIGERYGLDISVKEPKQMSAIPEYQDIKVDKWQISITTMPKRKDVPKQKIKIEVANIQAYSRIPLPLQQNYAFLPDGYSDMLIMTETLDEIMADKIVSFVSCQKYIRYRDIWDLRWLKQQGAQFNPDYILAKIHDYHEENYSEKLDIMLDRLEEIIRGKEFINEMMRFIPSDVIERTLQKEKFIDFLITESKSLLFQAKKILINDR